MTKYVEEVPRGRRGMKRTREKQEGGMTTIKRLKRQIIQQSTGKRKENCSSLGQQSTTQFWASASIILGVSHYSLVWCTITIRCKVHNHDNYDYDDLL